MGAASDSEGCFLLYVMGRRGSSRGLIFFFFGILPKNLPGLVSLLLQTLSLLPDEQGAGPPPLLQGGAGGGQGRGGGRRWGAHLQMEAGAGKERRKEIG